MTEEPNPNDFDAENSDVDDEVQRRAAFSETLAKNGYPGVLVLGRDRILDLADETRLAILDTLQSGPRTITELGDLIDEDQEIIYSHVAELDRLHIVNVDESNSVRLLHNHVVIEPLVNRYADEIERERKAFEEAMQLSTEGVFQDGEESGEEHGDKK